MRKLSELAIAGPARQPMTPLGSIDVTCRPKIAPGRRVLERAFLDHQPRAAFLACGGHLLGGLEDELDRAGELAAQPGEDGPTAIRIATCASWPHGVHDADRLAVPDRPLLRSERHVGALLDRQRVHVGAQRDDRPGRAPRSRPTTPVTPTSVRTSSSSSARRCAATSAGRADLAVAELGVLVHVAPPGDEARHDLGDGGVDAVSERVTGLRARLGGHDGSWEEGPQLCAGASSGAGSQGAT
jgi:hypothetical protein